MGSSTDQTVNDAVRFLDDPRPAKLPFFVTASSFAKVLTLLGSLMEFLPPCSDRFRVIFNREEGSCEITIRWITSRSRTTAVTGGDTVPSTPTASGTSNTPLG